MRSPPSSTKARRRRRRERDRLPLSCSPKAPGLLSPAHFIELGLDDDATEVVIRECGAIELSGYAQPLVQVAAYNALLERCSSCGVAGPEDAGYPARALQPAAAPRRPVAPEPPRLDRDPLGGPDRATEPTARPAQRLLMPTVWIEKRVMQGGGKIKHRVKFTLGGRDSRPQHGGQFERRRDAEARKRWVAGELAAMRVPDFALLARAADRPDARRGSQRAAGIAHRR